MEKLKIIVGGFIGLLPAGGVTWDYVQYPLGLAELGHDVYYIEDTRIYPIFQEHTTGSWQDASPNILHLENVMNYFGFKNKWAYRDEATGKSYGMTHEKIKQICLKADVFINVSCSTFMRDEYCSIPIRILIDSDPMFTQIQYYSKQNLTPAKSGIKELIDSHNHHFTFGENIGNADCRIPSGNLKWKPTRQPVCLQYWKVTLMPVETVFTTLMNWAAGKNLMFEDDTWGQKDEEFIKLIDLPKSINGVKLSVAINQTGSVKKQFSKDNIEKYGWQILDPSQVANNWIDYVQFINDSTGEFSVAKQTYVKARTGWFSCRSACYLAAGRPVITQDTGWPAFVPAGKGILAFSNKEEAKEALEQVIKNTAMHSRYAREIAEEYFDSRKVLTRLLDEAV